MNIQNMDLICPEVPVSSIWVDSKKRLFTIGQRWYDHEKNTIISFRLIDAETLQFKDVDYDTMMLWVDPKGSTHRLSRVTKFPEQKK